MCQIFSDCQNIYIFIFLCCAFLLQLFTYRPHYLDFKQPSQEGLKAEPERLAGEAVDAKVDGTVEKDAELHDEKDDLYIVSRVVLKPINLKIQDKSQMQRQKLYCYMGSMLNFFFSEYYMCCLYLRLNVYSLYVIRL